MSDLTQKEQCKRGCGLLGAGIGLAAILIIWLITGSGFLLSVLLGLVLGAIAFGAFTFLFCGKETPVEGLPPQDVGFSSPQDTAVSSSPSDPAPSAVSPSVASGATSTGVIEKAAFSGIKPSKVLHGEKELAERKGVYRYEAPKAQAAVAKTAEPASGAASGAAEAVDVFETADVGDVAERQPETLAAPRAGGADDLKLISGVGPKLEETLNNLGIYHYEQIANWGPAEIAWVDARVRFKGRITRGNWIAQAKTLAGGGET